MCTFTEFHGDKKKGVFCALMDRESELEERTGVGAGPLIKETE